MAQKYSNGKLAKAALTLLDIYPQDEVVAMLATLINEQHSGKDVDSIEQTLAHKNFDKTHQLDATVISAKPLTPGTKKKIIAVLKKATKATSVTLQTKIDPALISGVIIRTPTLELDLSGQSDLNNLKTSKL